MSDDTQAKAADDASELDAELAERDYELVHAQNRVDIAVLHARPIGGPVQGDWEVTNGPEGGYHARLRRDGTFVEQFGHHAEELSFRVSSWEREQAK